MEQCGHNNYSLTLISTLCILWLFDKICFLLPFSAFHFIWQSCGDIVDLSITQIISLLQNFTVIRCLEIKGLTFILHVLHCHIFTTQTYWIVQSKCQKFGNDFKFPLCRTLWFQLYLLQLYTLLTKSPLFGITSTKWTLLFSCPYGVWHAISIDTDSLSTLG